MPIDIMVNGELRAVPDGATILALLRQLQVDPARVAVELNRKIVKKPEWDTVALEPGSQVEIVQFVGGG